MHTGRRPLLSFPGSYNRPISDRAEWDGKPQACMDLASQDRRDPVFCCMLPVGIFRACRPDPSGEVRGLVRRGMGSNPHAKIFLALHQILTRFGYIDLFLPEFRSFGLTQPNLFKVLIRRDQMMKLPIAA
ncbi:hypothetical protein VTN49DRAFT_1812 [Thermomyces lanuginosus]|uniref:uncharacterized protein n=1 Tax=Thermomyces lanuginosus TaxID=5541 RepID=UPI0037445E5E